MGSRDAAAEHVARSRSTVRKSSRMSVNAVLNDSRTLHGASAERSAAGTCRSGARGDRRQGLQPRARGARRVPSSGGARVEASDEHVPSVHGDAGDDAAPVQPRGSHHEQQQTPHAMQWPSAPPQCEHLAHRALTTTPRHQASPNLPQFFTRNTAA